MGERLEPRAAAERSGPGSGPLHLAFLVPRFKTLSGAENLVVTLARQLTADGHRVDVLTRGLAPWCRTAIPEGVSVHVPPSAGVLTGSHLLDSFLDVTLSPSLLRGLSPDADALCAISDPVLPAVWFHRRIRRRRLPTVYYCLQPPRFVYDLLWPTAWGYRPLGLLIPLLALPYRFGDRRAVAACDRILAISSDYADWCRRLYGRPAELVFPGVERPAVDAEAAARTRARFAGEGADGLVLTVGKLIPRKRLDLFLQAMRVVAARRPGTRAVVVGEGPSGPRLRSLAADLGLAETVCFTGLLARDEDLWELHAACDVYVFLEPNVPFGLTVVEAGLSGKPVVAVRDGGTRDTVVDGETGLLVAPTASGEEVADAICRLLADGDKSRAMGLRAARHAERFTARRQADAFVAAVRRAIAEAADRDRPREASR